MIKMTDNEINEVRRIRHEISARFGHDIGQLVAHYQKIEKEFRRSGDYKFADSKQTCGEIKFPKTLEKNA